MGLSGWWLINCQRCFDVVWSAHIGMAETMKSWILLTWTTLNAWIFLVVEDPTFEAESPAGATIDTSKWIEIKHDGKPINGLATIRHIYSVGICGICDVQFKTVHPRVPKSAHALFFVDSNASAHMNGNLIWIWISKGPCVKQPKFNTHTHTYTSFSLLGTNSSQPLNSLLWKCIEIPMLDMPGT